ncbi:MAG: Pyridoxal 5'-phosphate synthase (glutamine hydrolyzing), glutaminase subunit [uncultured Thermomicrobiales bacterium]|uniref:Pyridoxal 5'-phosphate synthase subunit PdxT n=1 Tax=uncultured Thermomicrobiales bacterium TaxID=1645740 RepID=A0A6J4VII6_9BACT|nr:MAG: Pyridoxal 5'-phosphate synthase (glutamine hydrolyzing), glutaminase subunit [uncultured Thermomicrobiales bacterium]
MPTIGVLALQGAFVEHERALKELGAEPREVRQRKHLDGIDALIIPGGESTTIGKLLDVLGMTEPVRELGRAGMPIWGTCAGMILLAADVGRPQPTLGLLDIVVRRNAFGSQLDSFETDLPVPALGDEPFRAVFIRAPLIERLGPGVTPLATLPDGGVVAAERDNLLATAFHPELTGDSRFHRYFLDKVRGAERGGADVAEPIPALSE